ncbi:MULTISPECIES: iron ABC transporter permease [unclassified Paenibacillus]|uniref:FecCD family ABC transporter permease n=1 Tax=unclassified Paenibacillus TaxID=185978 RepID=UPI0024069501|nr:MULTISPECIES: iron ABC transporter permease [unclassified Paenibacillus]MDF9839469.1 iron complex transport system permease protein [Paenibacillus sp. PastF-2]MDF9846050.1 iron complex transport system permease protein [Paenibacillus sp. PastM-2]MDF9852623.1 iron complex transport system permease protein [Paenibacillus sp. PastF-1]MDH6477646.1 iron complex transport system permease protein [Paenibacillus sp. PastH-2]MDH6505388.1 iron complex transport system permease protein [Paenibacillus 
MKLHSRILIILWFIAAAAGLAVSIFLAVSFGAKELTLQTVWAAVFHYDTTLTPHQIVHDLRLPRVLGAVVTGMAFAVAGTVMQGVTRNPLADSGILGVNAGSAFAVALCFAIVPGMSYWGLILFSFAGAALATVFIVLLGASTPGGLTSLRLTIAGAVVAAILHSLSTGIAIYFDLSQDLAFWYAGGVAGVSWEHLQILTPVVIATVLWATVMGRPITFMSLGEETAVNLGVHTNRIRILGLTAAVILAGSSVAVAGSIPFVGLVVPHIARRLLGVDYRIIIPFSALLGAILLVWADFASRMVNPPQEFAIGAMVAMVGVPFFLYIARKEGRDL